MGFLLLDPGELPIAVLILYSIFGCIFIMAMAKIRFNIPKTISFIPITMQTFAINILPTLFGWKIGTLSAILYCIQVAIIEDIKHLYHETGGYFFGFILGSAEIGLIIEDEHFAKSNNIIIIAMIMGNVTILFCGMLWIPIGSSFKTGKSISNLSNFQSLLNQAVVPFIPGAIIKIVFAVGFRSYVVIPIWKYLK